MAKANQHIAYREKLLFELSREGKRGVTLEDPLPDFPLPEDRRKDLGNLPSLSESEVVRHFIRLSHLNFAVDLGFYPLGSCTMKYNPKVNEQVVKNENFSMLHPYLPEEKVQGILEAMYLLQNALIEISGLSAVTLQPAAGAHGELTGMMIMKAFHADHNTGKDTVLIPDTAHGTNPASCRMAGFKVIPVKVGKEGYLHLEDVKKLMNDNIAGIMITNPNTLGIYEEELHKIAELLHENNALVYGDGANMNALMGYAKPGDIGIDILHFNLHKTFSTPHGGGGPGAGPVAVREDLKQYLPVPVVDEKDGKYYLSYEIPKSIGKVKAFYGHTSVILKALAYILVLGGDGLKEVSEIAVLNACYIRERLRKYYHLPFETPNMHEVVFTDKFQLENGITTMDIAKALIDRGFHPPTVYFPLVVKDALMIEPTETESKEELDNFIDAMIEIAKIARENPEELHNAPQNTIVGRLDEVRAARHPKLKFG